MSNEVVIKDKLNEEVKEQKYLDYHGLGVFLSNLTRYISDHIAAMNGMNIPYDASTNSKSVSTKIDELWNMIGSGSGSTDMGGTLTENVAAILGQYVKRLVEVDTAGTYVGIKVQHGYYDNGEWQSGELGGKGIYTISINEANLAQKLTELSNNRVSKLEVDSKGAVGISVDNNTGDVKITIDSESLTNRVSALETSGVKSVSVDQNSSTTVVLTADPTSGDVLLKVDSTKIDQAIAAIQASYITDIDGKTGSISIDKENVGNAGSVKFTIVETSDPSLKTLTGSVRGLGAFAYCDYSTYTDNEIKSIFE